MSVMTSGGRLSLEAVLDFLDGQPDSIVGRVLEARSTILRLVPEATETVHWRSLSYHDARVGGHVKGAICQLSVCNGTVRMSFIHGASLPDRDGLLHGTRKAKRFVTIETSRILRRRSLASLVLSAAAMVAAMHGKAAPESRRRS